MSSGSSRAEEFTVDELAARAGMTVRNVRAYAGRGLIEAPRLEGRTGYYNLQHLQRLQLVRELLDRGYTLAAVEKAILSSPDTAPGHTLDLLAVLDRPRGNDEDETMSRAALAALAGVERDDALIEAMAEYDLVDKVDDDTVRLRQPTVVRAGAAAVSLGLGPEAVIAMFPVVNERLHDVAQVFVDGVVEQIVQPFLDAGMPEDGWPAVTDAVEALIPVASQVTLGIFRQQLSAAIDEVVAEKIQEMGD